MEKVNKEVLVVCWCGTKEPPRQWSFWVDAPTRKLDIDCTLRIVALEVRFSLPLMMLAELVSIFDGPSLCLWAVVFAMPQQTTAWVSWDSWEICSFTREESLLRIRLSYAWITFSSYSPNYVVLCYAPALLVIAHKENVLMHNNLLQHRPKFQNVSRFDVSGQARMHSNSSSKWTSGAAELSVGSLRPNANALAAIPVSSPSSAVFSKPMGSTNWAVGWLMHAYYQHLGA